MKIDKILSMLIVPVYLVFSGDCLAQGKTSGESTFTRIEPSSKFKPSRLPSRPVTRSKASEGSTDVSSGKENRNVFQTPPRESSFTRKRQPLSDIPDAGGVTNSNGKRSASPTGQPGLKKQRPLVGESFDDFDTEWLSSDAPLTPGDESQPGSLDFDTDWRSSKTSESSDESPLSSQDYSDSLPKPKFLSEEGVLFSDSDASSVPETPQFRGGDNFKAKIKRILDRAGYEKGTFEYSELKKQLRSWLRFITPFVGSLYPLQYDSETKLDGGARLLTTEEMGKLSPVKKPDEKKSRAKVLSETPVKKVFSQFSSRRELDSEQISFDRDGDDVVYDVSFSRVHLLEMANIKDHRGRTNLERMQNGLAPVVVEGAGKPKENGHVSLSDLIILHHVLQQGPYSDNWRGGHVSLLILPHLIHNHLHGPIHRSGVSLGVEEREWFDIERAPIWRQMAQAVVRLQLEDAQIQSEKAQTQSDHFGDVRRRFTFEGPEFPQVLPYGAMPMDFGIPLEQPMMIGGFGAGN